MQPANKVGRFTLPFESCHCWVRLMPISTVAPRYRRWIQCSTQQYELAKVAEAKEIPTVKVLTSNMPERKSFPPRLLIMARDCSFLLGLGVIWILA